MPDVINGYLERTKKLLYFGESDRLSFPSEIYLEMINRCNMHCIYCYKHNLNQGTLQFLKLELLEKILDEMSSVSSCPVLFVLEGGEPLLHPELLPILQIIKNHHYPIDILTNGELFTESMVDRMSEILDPNTDEIQISLDGISDKDNFNRHNNSIKVINNISLLNSKKITPRINCVITKYNVNSIPEYLSFINEHISVKSLSLNAVIGLSNKPLRAGKDELNNLSAVIKQQKYNFSLQESYLHNMYDNESVCNEIPKTNSFYRRCTALTGKLCISSNGDIYPCVFYENKMSPIGNINNQTIKEIWTSSNAEAFLQRKNEQLKKCSNCSLNQKCTQVCAGALL